ncbi:MAG TPA: acyl-ACP--UDP-N-acetylglucosamine O-acyltransferase [Gammaproteobacteria bacterium]
MKIHPTAIVSNRAVIAPDTEIGAYTVVEGEVSIGPGTVIDSHVRIGSRTGEVVIGKNNYVQSGASLGGPPQDLGFSGATTRLEIGDGNRIGEYATLNLGSEKGEGVTRLGDRGFIMAYAHVGHDCRIGDDVVITNLAQLAGHVSIGDRAILSGMVAITQFTRVGRHAFVAAGAHVNKDVLPYSIAEGQWARPRATNKIGLKRAGYDDATVREIDKAIRILISRSATLDVAADRVRDECESNEHTEHLLDFVGTSRHGVARA